MRCVGCIVETPDLYRFMTGRENLEHFARMLGVPADRRIERVAEHRRPRHTASINASATYSLGMRQRLGIAQALLGHPRCSSSTSPPTDSTPPAFARSASCCAASPATGMSVFVSSHLLAEIELMCDRVAIIHKGVILRDGTVRELIASQREMEFHVSDVARATQVLEERDIPFTPDHDRLFLPIEESDTAPIIRAFVERGIDVFSARPRVQTLEEMFIDVTGGETVD